MWDPGLAVRVHCEPFSTAGASITLVPHTGSVPFAWRQHVVMSSQQISGTLAGWLLWSARCPSHPQNSLTFKHTSVPLDQLCSPPPPAKLCSHEWAFSQTPELNRTTQHFPGCACLISFSTVPEVGLCHFRWENHLLCKD